MLQFVGTSTSIIFWSPVFNHHNEKIHNWKPQTLIAAQTKVPGRHKQKVSDWSLFVVCAAASSNFRDHRKAAPRVPSFQLPIIPTLRHMSRDICSTSRYNCTAIAYVRIIFLIGSRVMKSRNFPVQKLSYVLYSVSYYLHVVLNRFCNLGVKK